MKFHFEKTNKYVEIHRNRMNGIPLVFQNSRWLGLDWWMLHTMGNKGVSAICNHHKLSLSHNFWAHADLIMFLLKKWTLGLRYKWKIWTIPYVIVSRCDIYVWRTRQIEVNENMSGYLLLLLFRLWSKTFQEALLFPKKRFMLDEMT